MSQSHLPPSEAASTHPRTRRRLWWLVFGILLFAGLLVSTGIQVIKSWKGSTPAKQPPIVQKYKARSEVTRQWSRLYADLDSFAVTQHLARIASEGRPTLSGGVVIRKVPYERFPLFG
jgi:hypothetical protein